ncbi:hypothetical protein C7445_10886 [Alicyclobacillus sacchari]|uniref:Uncharacterized protein n=1 Tax=Alicyclobacillus sacchari TaxID=392010 RepID=A0A4R8LL18_9BACL|nr:hypothetical protein [Alicyclobacillus sacchari]TDY45263.1 hypothetical protein C7445_10886 [Alicyclobacillus sacchari]GMA56879.1 hypothetical protein GCM10025858_13820 [Alicyclobacillus sacchari]
MHLLTIALVVLLGIAVICLAIIAFVALTIYWTLEPILSVLGKISTGLEIGRFLYHRLEWLRRRRYKDWYRDR